MMSATKLLTDELRRELPALYSQDSQHDPFVYAKFFTPDAGWTWFVTEGEPDEDDFLFFGYVKGHCLETGYFSLSELEGAKGPFGLSIERDVFFNPGQWSEVKRIERVGD